MKNSPDHGFCASCDRTFETPEGYQQVRLDLFFSIPLLMAYQHMRSSSAHGFCASCDRTFETPEAYQQVRLDLFFSFPLLMV
jgi:DNA-directed RNA polymerase subunit RPC12/RpoP